MVTHILHGVRLVGEEPFEALDFRLQRRQFRHRVGIRRGPGLGSDRFLGRAVHSRPKKPGQANDRQRGHPGPWSIESMHGNPFVRAVPEVWQVMKCNSTGIGMYLTRSYPLTASVTDARKAGESIFSGRTSRLTLVGKVRCRSHRQRGFLPNGWWEASTSKPKHPRNKPKFVILFVGFLSSAGSL